jgi:DNA polymerase III alpha subunit
MIHLNAKTDYSFMKGFGSPEQWHERCVEIGATALGIADINSTWGHIPFAKSFTDVKLLLGVQVAVVPALTKDQRHGLVTLIAKSDEGLASLYKMMSLAHQQMYYRPRLTWKQLADLQGHCELIVNECSLGDFVDFEKLGFGYVGVGPRPGHMLHAIRDGGFQVVAAPSPAFPSNNHRQAYRLVRAIAEGQRFGEGAGDGFHMLRRTELEALWQGAGIDGQESWFENAADIADGCNASVPNATNIRPRVDDTLEVLARRGAGNRGLDLTGVYGDRLEHELSVIRDKEFGDYFLFVQDVVSWRGLRRACSLVLVVALAVGLSYAIVSALRNSTPSNTAPYSNGSSMYHEATGPTSTSTSPTRSAIKSSNISATPTARIMSRVSEPSRSSAANPRSTTRVRLTV